METISAPAAPRRLVGRLIPWTLASGLFAGGGFGVYHVAVPPTGLIAEKSETGEDPFAAPGSSPASTQIRQLFAQQPVPPTEPTANRYAAAAPPSSEQVAPPAADDEVAMPRNAAELTGMHNPASSASVPPDDTAEVTRGQEPGPNTLRQPAATASPAAETPMPAAETAGPGPGAAVSNPFAASNRYGAAPPAAAAAAASAAAVNAANAFGPAEPTPAEALPAASPTQTTPIPPGFEPQQPVPAPAAAAVTAAEPTMAEPPASPFSTPPAAAPVEVAARPLPNSFASEVAQSSSQPLNQLRAAEGSAAITPTPGLATADGSGQPGGRELEGLQSPAITVQKQTPTEIQVGRKCTFAVRVHNNSKQTVQGVQIHDEVPLGTQLIGTAPKAQVAGARILWDLGTMAPGEERIVEMELLPTTEGELGSVATVTFAAQASAKVRCTKPELALRLTAPPRVMIGEKQLVEIEVSNPGSGDATGVLLLETIPQGVSHEAGPALEFEVGTLKAGESRRLDLQLTAEQAGRINNMMVARGDANLEVQAACEFEVIAPALKVSIDGPSMRYLDRPATYTVNIQNPGTASAKEVQLITQLPKGLKFKTADSYGEYDAATHSVHWSLAELPANESGSVQLTALPVEAGEYKLQVATRAEQGLEDRTETSIKVEGLAVLSFEVKAADGAVPIGGETTYDVTVVNQGSKAAANVQVQVAVPDGLRALAGDGATPGVAQQQGVNFAPIAQLAPKAEAKFRIQVQGLKPGDQRAKIMVTADEMQAPITKEQSTQVYADQ
ncbi:MAG: DUF11 domain-containing protein [Planctomycetaceae bacterium]|nr:DUF11 domain-containing protein [Planctomycetaceae bacterium]